MKDCGDQKEFKDQEFFKFWNEYRQTGAFEKKKYHPNQFSPDEITNNKQKSMNTRYLDNHQESAKNHTINQSESSKKKKNLYETLGVSHTSTHEEIKIAYKRLVFKHYSSNGHRDCGDFAEVNNAYHILSDTNKRYFYNHFGQAGLEIVDDEEKMYFVLGIFNRRNLRYLKASYRTILCFLTMLPLIMVANRLLSGNSDKISNKYSNSVAVEVFKKTFENICSLFGEVMCTKYLPQTIDFEWLQHFKIPVSIAGAILVVPLLCMISGICSFCTRYTISSHFLEEPILVRAIFFGMRFCTFICQIMICCCFYDLRFYVNPSFVFVPSLIFLLIELFEKFRFDPKNANKKASKKSTDQSVSNPTNQKDKANKNLIIDLSENNNIKIKNGKMKQELKVKNTKINNTRSTEELKGKNTNMGEELKHKSNKKNKEVKIETSFEFQNHSFLKDTHFRNKEKITDNNQKRTTASLYNIQESENKIKNENEPICNEYFSTENPFLSVLCTNKSLLTCLLVQIFIRIFFCLVIRSFTDFYGLFLPCIDISFVFGQFPASQMIPNPALCLPCVFYALSVCNFSSNFIFVLTKILSIGFISFILFIGFFFQKTVKKLYPRFRIIKALPTPRIEVVCY